MDVPQDRNSSFEPKAVPKRKKDISSIDNREHAEAYNTLKRSLRKDTQMVLLNNTNFFNRIASVKDVYSFGFSFSDVDMLYVEEICNQLKPNKVVWNFYKYDWKYNRENVDKIREMFFFVRECNDW